MELSVQTAKCICNTENSTLISLYNVNELYALNYIILYEEEMKILLKKKIRLSRKLSEGFKIENIPLDNTFLNDTSGKTHEVATNGHPLEITGLSLFEHV